MLLPLSPLDPDRAYVMFLRDARGYEIVDLERPELVYSGPGKDSAQDLSMFSNGAVVFLSSNGAVRFFPAVGGAGLEQVLLHRPCPDQLLMSVFLRPDTQELIHVCRDTFAEQEQMFSGTVALESCPSGQQAIAVGYGGALLCSGPFADQVIGGVQARPDGGFDLVLRPVFGDEAALWRRSPSGAMEKLADYPQVPAELDGQVRFSRGEFVYGGGALLEDGTHYLSVRYGMRGILQVYFRLKPHALEPERMPITFPLSAFGHVFTSP